MNKESIYQYAERVMSNAKTEKELQTAYMSYILILTDVDMPANEKVEHLKVYKEALLKYSKVFTKKDF